MPSENLTDVEFIGEKALWFLRLTPEELKAHFHAHPRDAFSSIRHPKNGGMIIIGREAGQRFWRIGERHLSSHPERKVRTHLGAFVEQLRTTFSQHFLEEGRLINDANVKRWVAAGYRATAKDQEAATHYIPCVLIFSDSLKQFEVGPVVFLHESEFFQRYGGEIQKLRETIRDRHRQSVEESIAKGFPEKNAATSEQSAQRGNQLTDALLESFKRYHWFAVVEIPASDKEISYDRALFATRGALNIIKLLLGSEYTDRLRTADDFGRSGKTAKLRRGSNGQFRISISNTPIDNAVGDELLKRLNALGRFFTLPCRVLTLCSRFESPPPLCARYLDAISWFGDAIAEKSPAAKIVKFVTAIERVCGTGKEVDASGKERGVVDIVATRAAILSSNITDTPFDRARKEITKIYDCRSKLVHGSWSPFDDKVVAQVAKTDDITRLVLVGAIDFYNFIGLENPKNDEKGLCAHFHALEKWSKEGRPKPL